MGAVGNKINLVFVMCDNFAESQQRLFYWSRLWDIMRNKLKRVVIKEELVALTGDAISALVLNQFIYWSERRHDFDKFIKEERERNDEIEYQFTPAGS